MFNVAYVQERIFFLPTKLATTMPHTPILVSIKGVVYMHKCKMFIFAFSYCVIVVLSFCCLLTELRTRTPQLVPICNASKIPSSSEAFGFRRVTSSFIATMLNECLRGRAMTVCRG
ncbi:unnamed protein product [Orchesella dallaii]|uniref:Uncharacterized protein n=1 Tax=Orchesella dallaii TaxID=48710 RepID=A0ABP1Q3J8_9HEXA